MPEISLFQWSGKTLKALLAGSVFYLALALILTLVANIHRPGFLATAAGLVVQIIIIYALLIAGIFVGMLVLETLKRHGIDVVTPVYPEDRNASTATYLVRSVSKIAIFGVTVGLPVALYCKQVMGVDSTLLQLWRVYAVGGAGGFIVTLVFHVLYRRRQKHMPRRRPGVLTE
jgi:hypothetical protein